MPFYIRVPSLITPVHCITQTEEPEQLRQLKSYFQDIKIYSWKTGQEIKSEQELNTNLDHWLYYLCVIP
jgi:hypothetical protein